MNNNIGTRILVSDRVFWKNDNLNLIKFDFSSYKNFLKDINKILKFDLKGEESFDFEKSENLILNGNLLNPTVTLKLDDNSCYQNIFYDKINYFLVEKGYYYYNNLDEDQKKVSFYNVTDISISYINGQPKRAVYRLALDEWVTFGCDIQEQFKNLKTQSWMQQQGHSREWNKREGVDDNQFYPNWENNLGLSSCDGICKIINNTYPILKKIINDNNQEYYVLWITFNPTNFSFQKAKNIIYGNGLGGTIRTQALESLRFKIEEILLTYKANTVDFKNLGYNIPFFPIFIKRTGFIDQNLSNIVNTIQTTFNGEDKENLNILDLLFSQYAPADGATPKKEETVLFGKIKMDLPNDKISLANSSVEDRPRGNFDDFVHWFEDPNTSALSFGMGAKVENVSILSLSPENESLLRGKKLIIPVYDQQKNIFREEKVDIDLKGGGVGRPIEEKIASAENFSDFFSGSKILVPRIMDSAEFNNNELRTGAFPSKAWAIPNFVKINIFEPEIDNSLNPLSEAISAKFEHFFSSVFNADNTVDIDLHWKESGPLTEFSGGYSIGWNVRNETILPDFDSVFSKENAKLIHPHLLDFNHDNYQIFNANNESIDFSSKDLDERFGKNEVLIYPVFSLDSSGYKLNFTGFKENERLNVFSGSRTLTDIGQRNYPFSSSEYIERMKTSMNSIITSEVNAQKDRQLAERNAKRAYKAEVGAAAMMGVGGMISGALNIGSGTFLNALSLRQGAEAKTEPTFPGMGASAGGLGAMINSGLGMGASIMNAKAEKKNAMDTARTQEQNKLRSIQGQISDSRYSGVALSNANSANLIEQIITNNVNGTKIGQFFVVKNEMLQNDKRIVNWLQNKFGQNYNTVVEFNGFDDWKTHKYWNYIKVVDAAPVFNKLKIPAAIKEFLTDTAEGGFWIWWDVDKVAEDGFDFDLNNYDDVLDN